MKLRKASVSLLVVTMHIGAQAVRPEPTVASADEIAANIADYTPSDIMRSLVGEIEALSAEFDELRAFPEYARTRNNRLAVRFLVNPNHDVPEDKPLSSRDLAENGLYFFFVLLPAGVDLPRQVVTVTHLENLRSKLWTRVCGAKRGNRVLTEKIGRLFV